MKPGFKPGTVVTPLALRCSVLDRCATQEATDLNPESLRAFPVSPLTTLSNHSQITAYLNRAIPNHEESKPNKLHAINKCYRWKDDCVESYQRTIGKKNKKFNPSLDNSLDKMFPFNSEGVHLAVESLGHYIISANISYVYN